MVAHATVLRRTRTVELVQQQLNLVSPTIKNMKFVTTQELSLDGDPLIRITASAQHGGELSPEEFIQSFKDSLRVAGFNV
jgi:hypothetical protein